MTGLYEVPSKISLPCYWAAHWPSPVVISIFGRLCRKNDHPREGRNDVWQQETMFSALVSYDFPLQEYFLYLAPPPPPPPQSPKGIANQEGYLPTIDLSRNIIHDVHDLCFPKGVLNTNDHCKCEGKKQYNLNEP